MQDTKGDLFALIKFVCANNRVLTCPNLTRIYPSSHPSHALTSHAPTRPATPAKWSHAVTAIRAQPHSQPGFSAKTSILVGAGHAHSTSLGHSREIKRLQRFSYTFGYPPIINTGDVLAFLNSDLKTGAYLSFLATQGLAFGTARKALFSLRASTATADSPDPLPLSRFIKLVLKGYKQLFLPGPPRPIMSVPMFVVCARVSLTELLDPSVSFFMAVNGKSRDFVTLARWRAVVFMAFKGCLRRGEYLNSALLSPHIEFDQHTLSNLWPLMGHVYASLPDLWASVLAALHPKAVVSVTILSSKCDIMPAKVIITRDPGEPALCAVAAMAFRMVLMGPTLGPEDPFFAVRVGDNSRGPTAPEILDLLRSFLRRYTSTPEDIIDRLTLHGIRHGGASAAVLGGASKAQTKALGRWRGDAVTIYVSTTLSIQAREASDAISAAFIAPPVPLLRSLSRFLLLSPRSRSS